MKSWALLLVVVVVGMSGACWKMDEHRFAHCTACLRARPDACDTGSSERVMARDEDWPQLEAEAADIAVTSACETHIANHCVTLIRDKREETFTVTCTRSIERRGRPLMVWH